MSPRIVREVPSRQGSGNVNEDMNKIDCPPSPEKLQKIPISYEKPISRAVFDDTVQ